MASQHIMALIQSLLEDPLLSSLLNPKTETAPPRPLDINFKPSPEQLQQFAPPFVGEMAGRLTGPASPMNAHWSGGLKRETPQAAVDAVQRIKDRLAQGKTINLTDEANAIQGQWNTGLLTDDEYGAALEHINRMADLFKIMKRRGIPIK